MSIVAQDGGGINSAGDGSSGEDLSSHVGSATHRAELSDGGVGVLLDADAFASHRGEGRAGAGGVEGRAVPLHVLAESFGRVRAASHVGVLGLVSNAGSGLGDRVNPRVRTNHGASHTASGVSAVQHVLDGQVNVHALSLASDLDAKRTSTFALLFRFFTDQQKRT